MTEQRAGTDASLAALPPGGVDAFLSHFIISIRFNVGHQAGSLLSFSLPAAVQTVVRSDPFIPAQRGDRASFRLPAGSSLSAEMERKDFLVSPSGFFSRDYEQVYLQILNLDAKGDTPVGPVRIILGETFKSEYPDLYQPSFGAAQSIRGRGFPARLFFSPNAIIQTPLGAWKTRPKALVGAEINEFPPVGSYPSLIEPVPLDNVETLRGLANPRALAGVEPAATIQALAHPIDAVVLGGEETFAAIQRAAG